MNSSQDGFNTPFEVIDAITNFKAGFLNEEMAMKLANMGASTNVRILATTVMAGLHHHDRDKYVDMLRNNPDLFAYFEGAAKAYRMYLDLMLENTDELQSRLATARAFSER